MSGSLLAFSKDPQWWCRLTGTEQHKPKSTGLRLFFVFFLTSVHSAFLPLQTGRSSVRLHLGTEAHARKRSHRLQAVGASIQTEQLAGQHRQTRRIPLHCFAVCCTRPVKRVCQCRGWGKKEPKRAMQVKCYRHLRANKASLIMCAEELHLYHSAADSSNCTAFCSWCTCMCTVSFWKVKSNLNRMNFRRMTMQRV